MRRLLGLAISACLLAALPAAGQDRTILIGSVVRPDGTIAPDMAVVIAGGKVDRVVAAKEASPDAKDTVVRFDEHPGAVISPGLIDLRSLAGALSDAFERTRPVDPDLSALDAVKIGDRTFESALAGGITAVMIVPGETNIVGGAAATVRTHPAADGSLDVLRADGPMTFTLGATVLDQNRGPTSRAGAQTMLRDALAAAKAGKGSERLAKVINKEMDALVVCEAAEDVDAAARTFGEYSLKPNMVLGPDALEALDDLAGSKISVVLGPLTFHAPQRVLMGPAKAAKADVDLAFAGRTPILEPSGLRVTAALAVRYGLDPAAARLAMTRNAARVAGVADRVGTIEPGKDADIVVFSGDPLRLEAKVLEVYVKGVKAYVRPASESDHSWDDVAVGGSDHD